MLDKLKAWALDLLSKVWPVTGALFAGYFAGKYSLVDVLMKLALG